MFSKRAHWSAPVNELTLAQRKHNPLHNLTAANPTRAGIDYPLDELAEALARGARAPYDPDPRGIRPAREARGGAALPSDDLISPPPRARRIRFSSTAHRSGRCRPHAHAFLSAARKSRVDGARRAAHVRDEFHQRWGSMTSGRCADPRDRGVNPNNPTGLVRDAARTRTRWPRWRPIISDEVFLDYRWKARQELRPRRRAHLHARGSLQVGRLPHSSSAGSRQRARKREALDALELIATTSSPSPRGAGRTAGSATHRHAHPPGDLRTDPQESGDRCGARFLHASTHVLPVEGGWSA